jgi:FeS assembly SUF system protein
MPDLSRTPAEREHLRRAVIKALRKVQDPELPVNIFDLGLIYALHVTLDGRVLLMMTLTTPACPVAQDLVREVVERVETIDGVSECRLQLTWEPRWERSRMSERARLQLEMVA